MPVGESGMQYLVRLEGFEPPTLGSVVSAPFFKKIYSAETIGLILRIMSAYVGRCLMA